MKEQNASWFAARLLFESIDVESDEGYAFEERIVLLRAQSTDQAHQKAIKKARSSETEYETAAGNRIRWKFRALADVQSILDDEIVDGTEIYFSHLDLSRPQPLWTAPTLAAALANR